MPLRDHFHPPLSDRTPWDALHGAWPTFIVVDLNKKLSPQYVASPRIHLGAAFEIDVATSARDDEDPPADMEPISSQGGGGTAVWAPPRPTLTVETELPAQDEYEVRVFETEMNRLVAAVEIVSPANKDRPESRRAFATKCAALLQQGVSVCIVDLVTARRSNLYANLLDTIGETDPSLAPTPPSLYAAACRWNLKGHAGRFESWAHTLTIGQALPTIPLWLAEDLAMPLELDSTYEETCRNLRIR